MITSHHVRSLTMLLFLVSWCGGCDPVTSDPPDGDRPSADAGMDARAAGCGASEHACGDGLCLPAALRCDGVAQCADGSDESSASGCEETCEGCLLEGACVAGRSTGACGRGGVACVICAGAEECSDGACLEPPSCNPTTCPSGCCDGDTCRAGDGAAACGSGGAACERCGDLVACRAHADGQRRCTPECNASTCSGCCRADGTCAAGTSDSACGRDGHACAPCEGGTSCGAGSCVDDACLATCTGCCAPDGSCIDAETAFSSRETCGYRGGACDGCGAGEWCYGGGCVPDRTCEMGCFDSGACLPGTSPDACGSMGRACQACGDVLSCTERGCDVPFGTRWDVVLLDATIPPTTPDGSAWDAFGGLPDPFVELRAFAFPSSGMLWTVETRSPTINDTLAPNWDGFVLAENVDREVLYSIRLTVYDSDLAFNDTIGVCHLRTSIRTPVEAERLFSGEIQVCRTERDMVLRWQVRPHVP